MVIDSFGNGLTETRSYDQDYRLTSVTDPNVLSWTLGYNADDDITGITDNLASANNQSLGYDALNRLTTGSGSYGSLSYGYDADGNRNTETLNGTATTFTVAASSNQLASLSGGLNITYSYDADGNLTGDDTNTYSYDDTGQLASVTTPSGAVTYQYNALGQRVEKTVGGVTTVFIYDESGHLIGEYTPSGTLIAEHFWLNNRPIGVITPSGLYYVQTDQLGTPRDITNASKQLVWEWSSNPFGTTAPNQNPSGLGTFAYNLRFPGQYYDAETGHDYNYFRYYDPTIGKYIESDPIGLRSGANTYVYVLNDPLGFIDPFGLYWEYCQNTGALNYVNDQTGLVTPIATGLYSGKGAGKNNPADQYKEDIGPIPVGEYTIGPALYNEPHLAGPVFKLTPMPGTYIGKRTGGFMIHGDSVKNPGNASKGCIIAPHNVRQDIANSSDRDLRVVECN